MVEDEKRLEQLLRENLALARENNRMLRTIRRSMIWGSILRVLIWVVALGVPVLLYFYFFKPYFDNLFELYTSFGNGNFLPFLDQFTNIPAPSPEQ